MSLPAASSQCSAAGCADIFMPFVEECHAFAGMAGVDVAAMATYYTSCLRLAGTCGEGCSEFNLACRSEDVTNVCCGTSSSDEGSGCGPGYYDDPRVPCPEGSFCSGAWERTSCTTCQPCSDCDDGFLGGACGIGARPDHGMSDDGVCTEWVFCTDGENDCPANAVCKHDGPGTHNCECDAGYLGDGSLCTPVTHDDLKCAPCAAGTADLDSDPRTACVACPAGTYSPEFSTVCAGCPSGFHDTDADAATPCVADDAAMCSSGHYISPGDSSCSDCPSGTADTDGNPWTECDVCPSGTYASAGQTACIPCTPGTADVDIDPSTPCITCRKFTSNQEIYDRTFFSEMDCL